MTTEVVGTLLRLKRLAELTRKVTAMEPPNQFHKQAKALTEAGYPKPENRMELWLILATISHTLRTATNA